MNKKPSVQEFLREYLPELQELACWLLKQPETLLASFGEYADLSDEYVQEMLCHLSSLPAGETPASLSPCLSKPIAMAACMFWSA